MPPSTAGTAGRRCAGSCSASLLVLGAGLVMSGTLVLTRARPARQPPGRRPARACVAIAPSFGLSLFLFRVLPATGPRLLDLWPGALVSALGCWGLRWPPSGRPHAMGTPLPTDWVGAPMERRRRVRDTRSR
jgi:hypothetical protein